jgi:SAM-dependent methyltransferase
MSSDCSSREAEKEYLRRSGSAEWERVKPFAPPGESNLAAGLHLIQDFGACVALLDLSPDHRVLDLGAGGCWAADWLQRLGLSVVAADLSFDLLALGRERLSRSGPARAVCGDAEALPFRTATFDRVLCLNAMHHVPSVPAALREVARVVRPDGLAVFSEPGAGHARRADSVRAVQDFGVREAEVDSEVFLGQCREAGFPHAVLEPFAHVVPGHGLTADHWRTWHELASTARPRRALRTLRRAVLEFAGGHKDTELFPETFAVEVLRVLRAAMEDHPVVVASKRPLDRFLHRSRESQPALCAALRVVDAASVAPAGGSIVATIEARNSGVSTWIADARRRGYVRIGAQLLDSERRLVERDYARQSLQHDVPPGAAACATFSIIVPAEPGRYFLKFDLVAEGVTWFEIRGSTPALHGLRVHPAGRG